MHFVGLNSDMPSVQWPHVTRGCRIGGAGLDSVCVLPLPVWVSFPMTWVAAGSPEMLICWGTAFKGHSGGDKTGLKLPGRQAGGGNFALRSLTHPLWC